MSRSPGRPRSGAGRKWKRASAETTPEEIKQWLAACGFKTDKEAADALNVPFRTFGRYKAHGIPNKTIASELYAKVIRARMVEILQRKRHWQRISAERRKAEYEKRLAEVNEQIARIQQKDGHGEQD